MVNRESKRLNELKVVNMNEEEMEKELNKLGILEDWTERYIKEGYTSLKDENGKIIEYRKRWHFPNSFGISIIRGFGTHGGTEGLFEIAVLHKGNLCYSTRITDDTIGWLTPDKVLEYAKRIHRLRKKE